MDDEIRITRPNLDLDPYSLLDTHERPMVLIDQDYRIVAANRAYQESYGVGGNALMGRHCYEISHHLSRPCHENGEDCPHRAVFATGRVHEVRHIHYDHANHAEHVRIRGHAVAGLDGRRYLGEEIIRLAVPEEGVTCEDMRMVGRSPAFLRCLDHLQLAARTEASILLFGESGVGKELAASFVHKQSPRKGGPFVTLDCASLPENLFESEVMGHERGAFTGCLGRKRGLYEMADGGTLFLDEVGELPLPMQAKFLRVLETGTFRRLGGSETLSASVRVVAATNRDLRELVAERRFREDLYYRLAAITINLPPLRERREDIPAIARVLLKGMAYPGRPDFALSEESVKALKDYSFPGNVRELRNILQKAVAISSTGIIRVADLDFGLHRRDRLEGVGSQEGLQGPVENLEALERRHLEELLRRHRGNRRMVADALGVSERTVYRKLKRYALVAAHDGTGGNG